MHPKAKIDAATTAAQEAAAAAQESLNAAAHDAAAAAMDAAEQIKNTVKDYFPTGKTSMKDTDMHMHMHMPDKSHLLSFFSMPYMAVIIALIIVFLSALFFMKRRQLAVRPLRRALDWFLKTRGKSTVLMCGPVDAGKTLLFHTLSGGKFQPTQTSMEENVNTFKIHEKVLGDKKDKLCNVNFEFIDFPGHPSHEFKLTKFINHLRGVIILIDASSSDSILQGSKTLFTMLEKKGFMTKKIPVLICANKIDLSESQPLTAIRQKILEEMNKLRENRGNMETIQKGDEDVAAIGQSGERLTWDTLGVPVSFGQISAKQGNVTDVLDFLEGIQHC